MTIATHIQASTQSGLMLALLLGLRASGDLRSPGLPRIVG
jgi:hypothetical protein